MQLHPMVGALLCTLLSVGCLLSISPIGLSAFAASSPVISADTPDVGRMGTSAPVPPPDFGGGAGGVFGGVGGAGGGSLGGGSMGCTDPDSTLCVSSFGFGGATWTTILSSILTLLSNTILAVATACFIYGAFLYAASGGNESFRNNGKGIMIYALVGVAIVVGAQGIFNTVLYFLYGG